MTYVIWKNLKISKVGLSAKWVIEMVLVVSGVRVGAVISRAEEKKKNSPKIQVKVIRGKLLHG